MNLDSLLDTLTNVVGVLVIVLVMATLDVSSAVQRILEINPAAFGITPEKLSEEEKKLAAQQALLAQLDQQAKDAGAQVVTNNTQLNDTILKLQNLKLSETPTATSTTDPDELRKLIEELEKKSQQLQDEVVKAEEELAKLKAQLDDTPLREAPAPEIVHLPNPRDAPAGSKPVMVMCRGGKVMFFDPDGMRERAQKRVEFLMRPMQVKAGRGNPIDCEELVADFNKTPISDDDFRVKLTIVNYNLYVSYEQKESGETADRIADLASRYRRLLRTVDPSKYYLRYLVWADSFDAYIVARRISDEYNLPAGWEPYDMTYEWRTGLGIKVECQGKPAAPPPSTTSPSPSPPQPLPSDAID